MIVRFRTCCDGELWCAKAENDDIFAVGDSLVGVVRNVGLAARLHFGGRVRAGVDLNIMLTNEIGAGG
jgi:hypothetical protein